MRVSELNANYGESTPAVLQEKPPEFYQKKMIGQQIHLILTPFKTYGASSTKLHTEIRSPRR